MGATEEAGSKNRAAERSLIKRIIIYSAIKIRANSPAPYSILNPDTSSDSPSAKSKGVRFVSARIEINHMIIRGRARRDLGVRVVKIMFVRSRESRSRMGLSIIRAILTSYEIVWATLRMAPRRAYLEFENHPAARVVYTFILEIHKTKIMPRGINEWGIGAG